MRKIDGMLQLLKAFHMTGQHNSEYHDTMQFKNINSLTGLLKFLSTVIGRSDRIQFACDQQ
jgi:hypothetical protein